MWARSVLPIALLLALYSGLVGCASLSKKECLGGDWRAIGLADGQAGRTLEQLETHREACAAYAVQPDEEAYAAGRTVGLRIYCAAGHGFSVGSQGATYQGVCPPLLEGAFLLAFESGRQLYVLRSEFERVDRQVSEHENALRSVEGDLLSLERAAASEPDADRRRSLVRDLRRLAEERGRLRSEIDNLRGEQDYRGRRLEAFRAQLRRNPAYPTWQSNP